jgi:15-cis-phytoene synthase
VTVDACAELVARGDPDRFAAVMAAPVGARAGLLVLYAFNLEVARAPWVTEEPLIAEMRLQWWRDVVGAAASGAAKAHEVAGPLHDLIRSRNLPVDVLDRMVAARRWEVQREPFLNEAGLVEHIADTAGALMWLGACALGAPPAAETVVRAYGQAAGTATWLAAIPALEARGRQPMPQGTTIAGLAQSGLESLRQARAGRSSVPRTAAPALLWGWQTEGLLRQAVADPGVVRNGTFGLSEFSRRGRLAWQAFAGRW